MQIADVDVENVDVLFAGPQQNETTDWNLGLEYNKYLQEVVQILESDPEFRKKLESAKVDEIRDGTIAKELEYLSHGVRTKLDEIKRQELERLDVAGMPPADALREERWAALAGAMQRHHELAGKPLSALEGPAR